MTDSDDPPNGATMPTRVPSGADSAPPDALAGSELNVGVLRKLGEGGMGRVYLAHDRALNREIAVKVLSPRLARHEGFRHSFVEEARTLARLQHPGIVPVHAISIADNGVCAFSMQAVEGDDLHQWMVKRRREGATPESLAEGLEILIKVCDALAYGHSRGVLHCDLKPDNVMVGHHGRVYLMDWGLARKLDHEAPKRVAGTPAYMAPEQARCEVIDERADVFGVGAMLFELISGECPYGRASSDELVARAMTGRVLDIMPLVKNLAVSRRICRVAARAVMPDKQDRYQSIAEFRQAMREFLSAGFHLPRKAYARGTTIVKEGDVERTAYMIISGRCRAVRSVDGAEETLREMGPGEIFGELALLLAQPRSASVVVEQDCTVLVIDEETLDASGAMEGWTAALLRALAKRFRDLEASGSL